MESPNLPVNATFADPTYDYDSIPAGYYDEVLRSGHPVRKAWHLQKFERVLDCLSEGDSILDVGCFAGSFLSLIPEEKFARQLGLDIVHKQVAYAQKRYGTSFREFRKIEGSESLNALDETFDCITLIEVIEHLYPHQISSMLSALSDRLNPGGQLVVSTPNYLSIWPALEIALNKTSDVSYEEQHVTKFNYLNAISKIERIYPQLKKDFKVQFKTTTHFVSPFLASFSMSLANRLSRAYPHNQWHFPFGCLVLMVFQKR